MKEAYVFLYCPETADHNTLRMFNKKGYHSIELTNKPDDFWLGINKVGKGGTLVIFSHGDKNGPLMVKGTAGTDMTGDEVKIFADLIRHNEIKLYLLSCHTGAGQFAEKLKEHNVTFAAPMGNAAVGASSDCLSVKCKDENGNMAAWKANGIRVSSRLCSNLTLPSSSLKRKRS